MGEAQVRNIAFEALFVHGVPADESLEAALRAAGFDLKAQLPEYPISVLGQCLQVAIERRFPSLPLDQAARTMGNRFVLGILSTMLGKMVAVAVLVSGPDRTVKRIPSLMKSDYGVVVETKQLAPRHYEVVSGQGYPDWAGPFFHGIFEEALRQTHVKPESSVRPGAEPGSFIIDLQWPSKG